MSCDTLKISLYLETAYSIQEVVSMLPGLVFDLNILVILIGRLDGKTAPPPLASVSLSASW